MSDKICKIEGCDLPCHSKGWCHKHYTRNYYYGDPLFVKKVKKSEYPDGKKWCPKCMKFLDLNLFSNRGISEKEVYCKECFVKKRDKYRISSTNKYLLRQARTRAKKKGLDFNLDLSDISVPEICPVLNVPMSMSIDDVNYHPSLDRLDNSKGYIKGNVRVISWRANNIKSNAEVWEMELVLKYLKAEL